MAGSADARVYIIRERDKRVAGLERAQASRRRQDDSKFARASFAPLHLYSALSPSVHPFVSPFPAISVSVAELCLRPFFSVSVSVSLALWVCLSFFPSRCSFSGCLHGSFHGLLSLSLFSSSVHRLSRWLSLSVNPHFSCAPSTHGDELAAPDRALSRAHAVLARGSALGGAPAWFSLP